MRRAVYYFPAIKTLFDIHGLAPARGAIQRPQCEPLCSADRPSYILPAVLRRTSNFAIHAVRMYSNFCGFLRFSRTKFSDLVANFQLCSSGNRRRYSIVPVQHRKFATEL